MSRRTLKEFRHLAPAFAIAMLSFVPHLLMPRSPLAFLWMAVLFIGGCAIMGAEAFGVEFRNRTMGQLLAQPVSRAELWREKMRALGGALLVAGLIGEVVVLFALSPELLGAWSADTRDALVLLLCVALVPVCAFCSGSFWSLVFQNTLLAVIVSLAAPCGLLVANSLIHEFLLPSRISDDPFVVIVSAVTLIAIYSSAIHWLAWRRFATIELTNGNAAQLQIPAQIESLYLKPLHSIAIRFKGPIPALVKKELRLQQIPLFGAALFALVSVIALAIYSISRTQMERISRCLFSGRLLLSLSRLFPFWLAQLAWRRKTHGASPSGTELCLLPCASNGAPKPQSLSR